MVKKWILICFAVLIITLGAAFGFIYHRSRTDRDTSEAVSVPEEKAEAFISELWSITRAENENNTAGASVLALENSLFKSTGAYCFSDGEDGFYVITEEYPAGTEGRRAYVIKWRIKTPDEIAEDKQLEFSILIEQAGTYVYDAASGEISREDSESKLSLGGVSIKASLAENTDIITYKSGYKTVDSKLSEFTSEGYQPTLEGCRSAYGSTEGVPNAVLSAENGLSEKERLGAPGDFLNLTIEIHKPSDAEKYYTYDAENRSISAAFRYSVFMGNEKLTEKAYTISREY